MTEHVSEQVKTTVVSDLSPAHEAEVSHTGVPPSIQEKSKGPSLENNLSFDSIQELSSSEDDSDFGEDSFEDYSPIKLDSLGNNSQSKTPSKQYEESKEKGSTS